MTVTSANEMATFPRFTELPYELREKIWLLSIRDVSTPGIHFFRVHDDPTNDDHNVIFHRSNRLEDPILAAPQPSPERAQKGCSSSDASNPWRHNNDSTYLIDSGLWTACKESRALMEKQLKTTEFPKFSKEDRNTDYLADRPATAGFLSPTKTAQELCYFTVHPWFDVFVLQNWDTEEFDIPMINCVVPFAQRQYGFMGLGHVGIEFDPKHGEKEAVSLAGVIFEAWEDRTFFIIDYSARPISHQPASEPSQICFRGGKYTYVEGDASPACFDFITELELAICEINWENYLGDEPYYWQTDIAVLACVEL